MKYVLLCRCASSQKEKWWALHTFNTRQEAKLSEAHQRKIDQEYHLGGYWRYKIEEIKEDLK